jgi:FkbM family methyltransferase
MGRLIDIAVDLIGEDKFTLCDVGARGGVPSEWERFAKYLKVIAFEPDIKEADNLISRLKEQGVQSNIINKAIWSKNMKTKLYLTKSPASSSLFEPRMEFIKDFSIADKFQVVDKVDVEVATLDAALESYDNNIDFLKIDVQGGTVAVLNGSSDKLKSVVALEVEAEIVGLYKGSTLFGEIDEILTNKGFDLLDLRPTYWRRKESEGVAGSKGQIIYTDLLYMIKHDCLIDRVFSCETREEELRLISCAVFTCLVYGLNDRIVSYIDVLKGKNISVDEFDFIYEKVKKGNFIARLPNFYGRYFLANILKDLADQLHSPGSRRIIQDQKIGNIFRHKWFK